MTFATRTHPRPSRWLALLLLVLLAPPGLAQDQDSDSDGDGLPDWLEVDASIRLSYEHIENQFRANPSLAKDDQLILSRTLIAAKATFDGGAALVEVLDGRQALGSTSTPLGTGMVNTADILQAWAEFDLGRLGAGDQRLRIGRETLTLGSRRFVHRNGYRNTINSFTGVDWLRTGDEGEVTRAFWLMPVKRRPGDQASLIDNDHEWDTQSSSQQFAGVHHTEPVDDATKAEAFVFELRETHSGTRRRRLTTPGFRVIRTPAPGEFSYEVEGAYQFGDSRATAAGADLDHSAYFGRASVGYRLRDELQSHVTVAVDYASGDRNPTDGDNQRFDSLFGPPRFDFGPTNLYNAWRRSNLLSPELRWNFKPGEATNAFLAYRAFWLASKKDAWVGSGFAADPTGNSGDDLGQQIELMVRTQVIPERLTLEFGGAHLWAGSYVGRSTAGPDADDTTFLYTQATWRF